MTLEVSLSPDTEAKLRERAAASGKDVVAYVVEAVEEKLRTPASLAELLAPIHAATRQSGMSEDEIDTLIEETRDEVHAEKQGRKKA
ncbi:MAG: hypothetical protein L6R00_10480 [Phycisphaerae bacterium]|nr:hypothetical protein [Phycisphaerae bacterium]